MSDVFTKEWINQLVRRHKRKARRHKKLEPAMPKPAATGGVGVCDAASTKVDAT